MSSHVSQIQKELKDKGFYKGAIDGIAGKLTVSAVREALKFSETTSSNAKLIAQQNKTSPLVEGVTPKAVKVQKAGTYFLSDTSLKRLQGVNANLVKVVKRAIELSGVDFGVTEGLRTLETQKKYVAQGKSKTMNSKHLTGHAVDLAAYVNGELSWDFNYYYVIAKAMQQASEELGVKIRWGGSWDVITGKTGTPEQWVESYKALKKREGKRPFLDGVHFEIV